VQNAELILTRFSVTCFIFWKSSFLIFIWETDYVGWGLLRFSPPLRKLWFRNLKDAWTALCGITPFTDNLTNKISKAPINKSTSDYSLFFLSFLVLPSSTYLLTAGVEGFCDFIWSHSDTHHIRWDSSGRGIGPSQRTLSDNTNTVQDKCPCSGGIRTHDPSKRSAADPRLRPRRHWNRPIFTQVITVNNIWRYNGDESEEPPTHSRVTPPQHRNYRRLSILLHNNRYYTSILK
jgi:hypothetical protein